jgi:hypothetical protein
LSGTEISGKYKAEVETIPGVELMQVGVASDVPGEFDFVTMVHVLEHMSSPVELLVSLKPKLVCGGSLLIEVPHYIDNPFDLLIADHSTHFSSEVLRSMVMRAGYHLEVLTNDWVVKELTLIAKPSIDIAFSTDLDSGNFDMVWNDLRARVEWLSSLVREVRQLVSSCGTFLGLFGSSIAAIWLFGELEGHIDFFIDEDPMRVGRMCLGKPIISPQQAPKGSVVYMALPPEIANTIKARLQSQCPNIEFRSPKSFTV